MPISVFNRRNLLSLACAVIIAGIAAPDFAEAGKKKKKKEQQQVQVIQPSDIALSPGYFNGRDSSGTNIRAQVKRAGRDFKVQDLKGKNGPERLYRDTGNNTYRAANGYYITVSSTRQFYWKGPHGALTMND